MRFIFIVPILATDLEAKVSTAELKSEWKLQVKLKILTIFLKLKQASELTQSISTQPVKRAVTCMWTPFPSLWDITPYQPTDRFPTPDYGHIMRRVTEN